MMSLQNELESILIAAEKVVYDCNTVLDAANVPPVSAAAELPERIQGACDTRYEAGREDGIVQGEDMGRQAVYDMFWDTYQDSGNRTSYEYAFFGKGWTDETFQPKYRMYPTNMSQCFYTAFGITDIPENMLDTSRCTNLYFAFASAGFRHLPIIDMRAVTSQSSARYLVYNSDKLEVIDGIYLPSVPVEKPFYNCKSLREVRLLGEGRFLIDLDMSACPLSRESVASVMAALSDTVTGKTVIFKRSAAEAFTAEEWAALTATKANWTVEVVA